MQHVTYAAAAQAEYKATIFPGLSVRQFWYTGCQHLLREKPASFVKVVLKAAILAT